MSAMSDFAIFEMSLDFVSIDELHATCCDCSDDDCGAWWISPDNRLLCESCFDEHYFTCECCDDITPNDDCTTVDDESWCPSCRRNSASHCSDCGSWTHDDNTTSCGHGTLCESCYEDSYFTCDACNETLHNDDCGEDGLCQSCSDTYIDTDPDQIMSHEADICDILNIVTDPKTILYGIELEVSTANDMTDCATDCRQQLREDFTRPATAREDYCITKHDGSLGCGGFEIVTIPESLQDHTRRWSDFLNSPPRGLRSWDTGGKCGMHVHVSRAPLSLLTIGKLLVFINADENMSFIVEIAGRDSESWAKRIPKKISDAKRYPGDRYQALNLCNRHTIEFRIFRGTLKKQSFLKNLEFVVASVAFCQQAGIHCLDVPSFLMWFKPVRKDYPNLDSWLVQHGHIKARSKPVKIRSTKGGE